MWFFAPKSLVEPLFTGQPGGRHWEDYPPNHTQAKQARAQGGAVTYAHPSYLPGLWQTYSKELPVDLALGEVGGMDLLTNSYERTCGCQPGGGVRWTSKSHMKMKSQVPIDTIEILVDAVGRRMPGSRRRS